MPYNVAVLVGSLRKDSFNRKIAHALTPLAAPALKLEIIEIGDLPFFNQDLEATPPQPWVAFRAKIKAADAALFVTAEYNRGLPAVLKNAIDVGSRPYGQSVWDSKPAGIISSSMGQIGGYSANHQLRQSFVFLNMPAMQQPEAYLSSVQDCFDSAGNLTNDKTRDLLKKYAEAFAAWIHVHLKK